MGCKITALEYYLPRKIISNQDLEKDNPGWDSTKAETKIGISKRHIAGETETAVDLAEKAAEKVLQNFDRAKIDFLILCTQSPDYFIPTSSCILQNRLDLRESIGAYDFNLGCSGFIYGLAQAKGLIEGGIADNVLLIVSDTYSKHIYKKDAANRAIFGDGAAATIVSRSDSDCVQQFTLGTCGAGAEHIIEKNGGFRHSREQQPEEIAYGTQNFYTNNHLYMNGPEVFNFTIEYVPRLVESNLKANGVTISDVDYFIYHQANKFMLNYLRRKSQIPRDKFYLNLTDTGNIVSATIPVALKRAIETGKVEQGSRVLLAGFGVGYSWGATLVTV